jgi:hypothetical protein
MTQETLEKAIELKRKLTALETLKNKLESPNVELVYLYTNLDGIQMLYGQNEIKEIFKSHDLWIRTEIDKEILNVRNEIEQL